MQKLKFIYQNWNREYYELQSEEDTCSYYKNFYKGKEFKILPQILAENTKNTEEWAKYAFENNEHYVMTIFNICLYRSVPSDYKY